MICPWNEQLPHKESDMKTSEWNEVDGNIKEKRINILVYAANNYNIDAGF